MWAVNDDLKTEIGIMHRICAHFPTLFDCVIAVKLALLPSYFPTATPFSESFISIENENAGLIFILRNILITQNWSGS